MAPRFFGTYEHSLDAKGRIILPARFRSQLGTQAYVSKYRHGCLALWTSEEFEKQMAEQEAKQGLGDSELNQARIWAAGSSDIEVDTQGRIALPANLRTFAGLETQNRILVVGALNRVELWNPAVWEQRVGPAEAEMVGALAGTAPSAEVS
ncbi:MAG TPA: division/cell wall cluster transcriptional repressor MraZ [Acidimicrobiales bacterium]|nr:division/cell wall cluster transcriptional repressor MraZ [Acidimicrobiales bacterium]